MSIFTKNAGRILNSKETQAMTEAYRDRKVEVGLKSDEYVRSEFFGLNHVLHLLNQEGCVGLRVHHAKRWEDIDGKPTEAGEGELRPRVLLTGVDAKGNDLFPVADRSGMKDTPSGNGGGSVGDGWQCPKHCAGIS